MIQITNPQVGATATISNIQVKLLVFLYDIGFEPSQRLAFAKRVA